MKLFLLILLFPLFIFGKTITLTENNFVQLKGTVTWTSMGALQHELLTLSARLEPTDVIYLVLNSKGGDLNAGWAFIETLTSIKQPVHTISFNSMSMSFFIAQYGGTRYIIKTGRIMAHRAVLEFRGRIEEIESELKFYKDLLDIIEQKCADRMQVNLKHYRKLIHNELYVTSGESIKLKMADEIIAVKCTKAVINKRIVKSVIMPFGPTDFTFSFCPLVTGPIE